MVDSGMVARALLIAPQWRRIRSLLARLGGLDASTLDDTVPFLVALHDIGKAAPGFQRVVPALWGAVQAVGFIDCHPLWGGVRFRHDVEGYVTLADHVLPMWVKPRMTEPTPLRTRRVFTGLAQALGGHHGAYVSAAEVQENGYPQIKSESTAEGDRAWNAARAELVHALAQTFEVLESVEVAAQHLSGLCSVLNGFTILSDWIASNEEYFPCAGEMSSDTYSAEAWSRAKVAVDAVGLLRFPDPPADTSFSALFPMYEARPVQAALDVGGLDGLHDPTLAVIEAPTGEGKTEAALLLAQRLIGQSGGGMYFALPTMATSEQLFQRVAEFFADSFPGGGTAGVTLVHGQSDLSPALQGIARHTGSVVGETTDPVVVDSWFLPRKRALLAPFGVGTVDQAMLAALRVRHGSLRLLGFAGKVVVIDEIHAYDAYMSVIIERLLEWLAELGVSVILLSATLPAATRTRFLTAYGATEVTDGQSEAYPLITLVRPGGEPDCIEPRLSDAGRSIALDLAGAEQSSMLAADTVTAAVDGAAVGWVCDTVGSAQDAFREVRTALDRLSPDARPPAVLYHARMLAGQRRRIEQRVQDLVGKESVRTRGCIVVATQVVEQSLDIDFDLLLSELAPMDLLIQRIGRLHRHKRQRPAHVARPLCRLLLPARLGGAEPASPMEWVYQPFVLIKTLATLLDRSAIDVPIDVRPLVESVYDDVMPDAATLERIGVSAETARGAWTQLVFSRQTARDAARMFTLGPPDGERFTAGERGVPLFDDLADDDVLERDSVIGAQTRLSAPSARIVFVEHDDDQLRDGSVVMRDERLPDELARWLLNRSVSISHHALLAHIASGPSGRQPKSFSRTPALRNHTLLRTVESTYEWQSKGRAYRLTVDEEYGVVIQGVDGAQ
jgi:CRISPR-associated endonuclease/helicase Cas3